MIIIIVEMHVSFKIRFCCQRPSSQTTLSLVSYQRVSGSKHMDVTFKPKKNDLSHLLRACMVGHRNFEDLDKILKDIILYIALKNKIILIH